MTAPGTYVAEVSAPPARGVPTDTGTWFVTGLAERGDTTKPVLITSMTDYATYFGSRVSYGTLYDPLEAFFRNSGARVYVQRIVGGAAATAGLNLQDTTPVNTVRVTAENPGTWGNNLQVQVIAGTGGTFIIIVTYNGTEVVRSPQLTTKADVVAWGGQQPWINIADLGAGTMIKVTAATSLTGGLDDSAGVGDAQYAAGLALFTSDLGPGQVSSPGRTSDTGHLQLLAHAALMGNRTAVMDAPDTATASTLTASAAAAKSPNGAFGGLFAPWLVCPGLTAGTTRTIPPCALAAARMAAVDAQGNPNLPAAGLQNGVDVFALGVTQTYDDTTRDTLNTAGVNVVRQLFGLVTVYGYRTLADPTNAPLQLELNNQRLIMAVKSQAMRVSAGYAFAQLDGQGVTISKFNGDLTGVMLDFYNAGALFGATPADAFVVDTGPSVNTPTTIANRELHAQIGLRVSHEAELVYINIVRSPTTQAVA